MQLKALCYARKCIPGISKQMLLIMKLTTILLFAAIMQVSARGYSQQITLSMKNVSLETVFKELQKQSGYTFVYSKEDLEVDKSINIEVSNAAIDDVLKLCLKGLPLNYSILDKFIVIKPREAVNLQSATDAPPPPIDIKGHVVNENGEPVIGATVQVKGTHLVTTTDGDGNFELKGVDEKAVLVITATNIEKLEVKVNGKTSLSLVAKIKVAGLEDVVLNKGYYSTTQRLNTGNVSKVNAKEIGEQPVSDPLMALEGRVPGLYIQQTSGVPGAYSTVRLRGQNSITNGNDPLYIVDGVPFSSASLTSNFIGGGVFAAPANGSGQGMSPFNALNPSDIESIEVLKDADATAIYGSRGANGVILVTTKKGKIGDTKVDVNVNHGTGQVTRQMDLLNTQQYLAMRNEAFKNDGQTPDATSDYDLTFWDTNRYTSWQKVLIGNPSPFTNAQASLSGGNSNTQFIIGGGYNEQGTPYVGNYSDQKASAHISLTHASSDQRFHAQFSANYVNDNSHLPNADLTQYITLAPDAPTLYNSSGGLNWQNINGTFSWINPLFYTAQHASALTTNLISSMNLSYQILPALQIKGNFGYNHDQMEQSIQRPSAFFPPPLNLNPSVRSNNFATTESKSWIIEPQLNYTKKIAGGQLDVLLGASFQGNTQSATGFNASGFTNDALIQDPQAASSVTLAGSSSSLYHYTAVFGRIGYNWEEKYLFNLTARRDGSSRFGPGKQFGNFGAIGTGWIFSKEKFIQDAMPFLSFGKLRANYGITGNDQIGNYQFLSTYTPYYLTYQGITGLSPTGLTNPYFAWEVNKKLEGGLDLGFFKDRILLSISYYRNRSGNQLVGYPLPQLTGFSSVQANLPATVQNTGLEFTLSTINIRTKKFTWTSSANLSIPQNKLIAYPGIGNSAYYPYDNFIGHSTFSKYVYHSTGVDPQTGAYTFISKDGNGIPSYPDNLIISKPVTQSFFGGINNSFGYKCFHLDVFIQFVKQLGYNYLYNSPIPGTFNNNLPTFVLGRWQKPGDITDVQKFTTSYYPAGAAFYNWQQSDAAISGASFMRLKNLAFSYDLPTNWIKKARLQQTKLYLQCQNLFTITGYKGLDPETQGLTLPPLRMITLGIQATL